MSKFSNFLYWTPYVYSITISQQCGVDTFSMTVFPYFVLFRLVGELHIECLDIRHMGQKGDGGWDICLSPPFTPKQNDCLVYSFGYVMQLHQSVKHQILFCVVREYFCKRRTY